MFNVMFLQSQKTFLSKKKKTHVLLLFSFLNCFLFCHSEKSASKPYVARSRVDFYVLPIQGEKLPNQGRTTTKSGWIVEKLLNQGKTN